MILFISSVTLLLIIVWAIATKDPEKLMFCIFPILFGYGLLGMVIPIKETTNRDSVYYYCSPEFGECKLTYGSKLKNRVVKDYVSVDYFIHNAVDSITITKSLNSYGGVLEEKIILPNNKIYLIK